MRVTLWRMIEASAGTSRQAPGARERFTGRRRTLLVAGAAAGVVFWMCAMALGIPEVVGFRGHDFMIPAALIGALLALTPLRSLVFVGTAALGLVAAVVAYTPLIERPARSLVRRDPAPAMPSGAVIVLGADVTTDSLLHGQALDRVLGGIELVKRGVAPILVLPGNTVEERGRSVPATPDQLRLVALAGIGGSTLLVTDSVRSTRDEAVRARQLLHARGIRHVQVVTSPMHTWRACRAFERVGLIVTCTPSVSRDVPMTPGALYRSADRLAAFRLWLYEQVASGYYHMRGWI